MDRRRSGEWPRNPSVNSSLLGLFSFSVLTFLEEHFQASADEQNYSVINGNDI